MPRNVRPLPVTYSQKALMIAVIGAIILLVSVGARQTYGLFLTPISEKLSLGRQSFSLAVALASLVWGLVAPFTGRWADRYGPFWILMIGAFCFAAGFLGLGLAGTETDLIFCGLLMGVGLGATGFTVILGTVGRVAETGQRDFLITIASMGSAVGLFLSIPFAGWLLATFSLADSLYIIAVCLALIGLLAVPFARYTTVQNPPPVIDDGMSYIKHGLSNYNYILLMAGFFVCGFHIAFTAVHLPAFIEDTTGGKTLGTIALFLIGLGNVFGTYFAGRLGERFSKARVLSLIYLLRGVVFLGFLLAPVLPISVYLLSFAMGLLWLGTIPLTSGLVAEFYGTKWLSMMFGLVFLSHQVGSFFGAWLGGLVFDLMSSYQLMWLGSAALAFLSCLLHLPIKAKRQITGKIAGPKAF